MTKQCTYNIYSIRPKYFDFIFGIIYFGIIYFWDHHQHIIYINSYIQAKFRSRILSHIDLHDADTVTDDDASLIWILIYVVRTAYPHTL